VNAASVMFMTMRRNVTRLTPRCATSTSVKASSRPWGAAWRVGGGLVGVQWRLQNPQRREVRVSVTCHDRAQSANRQARACRQRRPGANAHRPTACGPGRRVPGRYAGPPSTLRSSHGGDLTAEYRAPRYRRSPVPGSPHGARLVLNDAPHTPRTHVDRDAHLPNGRKFAMRNLQLR
jgi:hypothetical protein